MNLKNQIFATFVVNSQEMQFLKKKKRKFFRNIADFFKFILKLSNHLKKMFFFQYNSSFNLKNFICFSVNHQAKICSLSNRQNLPWGHVKSEK